MTRYICNLLIPGAAKSGTSSLHEALGTHPEICMSVPKEPQFFSFDEQYATGADGHNALFCQNGKARYFGESSQCYFTHEHAIDRIARSLTSPKIILLLREPIGRLLSQYAWNFKRATERDDLFEAIRKRGESTEYIFDPRINAFREIGGYLAFSRYSRWVPFWRERFPDVLCLRFEDFVERQAETLSRCFRFLGVDDIGPVANSRSNSTETTVRAIYPGAVRLGARAVPAFVKKNPAYGAAKTRLLGMFTPSPDLRLDDGQRALLEAELAPDIAFYRNLESL